MEKQPPEETQDERVRRSKEAVLTTTHQLLTEEGFGGVTIDAVAKLSGIAKSTIYRHWPTRTALLIDACSKLGSRAACPNTGSLEEDLEILVTDIAGRLQTARWPSILPSIIDEAERDTELASLHARLHGQLIAGFYSVLERAEGRGEMVAGVVPSRVVATILGPLFYRRWFSREPLDRKFVKSVIDTVLTVIKRR